MSRFYRENSGEARCKFTDYGKPRIAEQMKKHNFVVDPQE